MPPCLGSSAMAAVKETAAINSELATTSLYARRIANPPHSPGCRRAVFPVPPVPGRICASVAPAPVRSAGLYGRSTAIKDPPLMARCSKLLRKSPRWQGILARLVDAPMRVKTGPRITRVASSLHWPDWQPANHNIWVVDWPVLVDGYGLARPPQWPCKEYFCQPGWPRPRS